MVKDPVCEMEVTAKSAKFKSTHRGKTYYFDSKGCKDVFDKDPQKYVEK
jgi:YHS domain-containing protein